MVVDDNFRSVERRILQLLETVRHGGQVALEILLLQRLVTVREKQERDDDAKAIALQIEILEHRLHLS
jgi:hypothetical protein